MDNALIVGALNIIPDAQRRLSLLLDRTRAGNEEVFTSPILGDRDATDLLKGWDAIYESGKSKIVDELQDLEVEQNRSKFGPMSIAARWDERRETLLDSFGPQVKDRTFAPPLLNTPLRLRPISVPISVGFLKNDSNSGLPQYTKKKNVKDQMMGYTLDDLYKIVSDYLYKGKREVEIACVLFTRTQELAKTRNVWGFSVYATLLEMCFYRPVLDIQSKQTWRAALLQPDDVSAAITRIIDYAIANSLEILSIDFKRYDNSCKSNLIGSAFASIMDMFQHKYHRYITLIKDFFIECPIVTPDGVLVGKHGVPSGSTFTNEVDSIIQKGIADECENIIAKDLAQVQGDDGVYIVNDSSKVIEHFGSYGLVVGIEKSYVGRNWCVFLQYLFHDTYRAKDGIVNGIYPTYRALNRIIYPERFENFVKYDISGRDYFAIRTIAILENCKHHPLFNELVIYVAKLDKYNLKFSDQGLASFVKRLADKEGKDLTFKEWTYGSDVKGLKSFETYKLLREYWVK